MSRPVPEIQTGAIISWNKNDSHQPAYLNLMIFEGVIEEETLFIYGVIDLSEQKFLALTVPIPHLHLTFPNPARAEVHPRC